MALTLTIDLGTTNLKVGLVNERGEIQTIRSSRVPTISHEAGAAEHDPETIKDLALALSKEALKDRNRDEIDFVICSTYQFGLMLLDERKQPVSGMTLLTDIRPQQTFANFISWYKDEQVYEKTGCPLISQYVLPRLYYFFKEKSSLLQSAKYFADAKSFLFEWLTGEWVTDYSTAAATQFFNAHHYRWDQKLLDKLHLSAGQFPLPEDGTAFLAPLKRQMADLLGLKKEVKVVLGVYDGAALGVGLSGLAPKVGIVNLGTTAMLRVPGSVPVFDKDDNKRIQAYAVREHFYLNGGALNNAALPLDWIRTSLFEFDLQDQDLLKLSDEPPLISLPYLTGERDSLTGPFASGVFFGIRRSHAKVDFVRSIMEGVAYSLRYLYDALSDNNLVVDEVRMGGGGVNIRVWPQIFADVLNLPVTLSTEKEMALAGNAMLAFTAGGLYRDLEEASRYMLKPVRRIEPDKNAAGIRDKHYHFFKKLRESLAPLYQEHSHLRSVR